MKQKFSYQDKLLFELTNNSRLKKKDIGKKLHISPQLINYAVDKMFKQKIISNYEIKIDPAKLGLINVLVFIVYTTFEKEKQKKIKEFLFENDYVTYIDETSHKADLMVEYTIPNLSFFNKIHTRFIEEYNNEIKVIGMYPVIVKHKFSQKFLNKRSKISKDIILSGDREKINLSTNSRQILSCLIENPNIKITDIEKKTKLNVRTIINKIKILEKNEIIRNYGIIINYKKLNISVANVLIKMHNQTPNVMNKMVNFAQSLNEVTSLTKLLGVYNLLLRIESFKNYSDTLNQLRAEFKFYDYIVCDSSNILKNTYIPKTEILSNNKDNNNQIY
ncbi:MAG: winged helix-turn-helix transcriptional regulator [Candidatus Woesearchaeota archaeon]